LQSVITGDHRAKIDLSTDALEQIEEWQSASRNASGRRSFKLKNYRGVAEWSNAAVLKTVVPQGTGGSNPSSSAFS
jgi:hypothetical protein